MATVRYFPPKSAPQLFALHKPVTTIGRALGNDIHIPDATVHAHHAQIVFNGRDFQFEEVDASAEITVNGKKKRRARLANGDRLCLGDAHLSFSMFSELPLPAAPLEGGDSNNEVAGFRRLHEFSERIMSSESVDQLLEVLLGALLELTGAARGMVLLVDGGDIQVRASRNVATGILNGP
ncbi:MAG TPA: FHA domain-containing protein, partial [Polyangiaceae bacterium]|nr:FHA domain-containing protein [Polyangiaceae bacterium]